jgi:acyl-CoA synthetase (AMP-forming)/AMP-acid ligase II
MSQLLNVGEVLTMNAILYPEKIGARDLKRSMTFRKWNERACRLANALIGLGLKKGDRFAILAYNSVEWMEIYAASAKSGLIAVPINFRLAGPEIAYILENSDSMALIVEDPFVDTIESIRKDLAIPERNYISFGMEKPPPGYRGYEELISMASPMEPEVDVKPEDTWTFMYTSGTTGRPKGAIRSHESYVIFYLLNEVEFGFNRNDNGLLVMPMCHVNSIFYSFVFTYCGASVCVYNMRSFDPEHLLRTLAEQKITFTSLVPTHYIMMLSLPEAVKNRYNMESVRKLLISSAPARKDTKLGIMEYFRNSSLFEAYGSTEAGLVTLLRPEEQLSKIGSIGREIIGSGRIRLLDEEGKEVPEGEVGELYSRTPTAFSGYWKMPDKTAEAFRGPYCTAGDMAKRDEDGYYILVDRKSNMIITGGENVYPSEVENVVGSHPKVKDVAVIGLPDEKWGEAVTAVVILHEGMEATEKEIIDHCRGKIAGYKRPKSVIFIKDEEMPRTATGKILHRILRERYAPLGKKDI